MNSMQELRDMVSQMPDQTLQQAMQSQNAAIPPFQNLPLLAMLEAKQRGEQRQQSQANQAVQSMNQPTLAQQYAQGLEAPGLEQHAQSFARGGLVALAGGGDTESIWERLFGHAFDQLPEASQNYSDVPFYQAPALAASKLFNAGRESNSIVPKAQGIGALTNRISDEDLRNQLEEDIASEASNPPRPTPIQPQMPPQGQWQQMPQEAVYHPDDMQEESLTGKDVVNSRQSLDKQLESLQNLYGAPPSMAAELKGALEKELAGRQSDIEEAKWERGLGALVAALGGYFGAQGSGDMRTGQGLLSGLGAYLSGTRNIHELNKDTRDTEMMLSKLGLSDAQSQYQARTHMMDQLLSNQAAQAKSQGDYQRAIELKQLEGKQAKELEGLRGANALKRTVVRGSLKGIDGITPKITAQQRAQAIQRLMSNPTYQGAEPEEKRQMEDEALSLMEEALTGKRRGPSAPTGINFMSLGQ